MHDKVTSQSTQAVFISIKPTPHRYIWIVLIAFLAACEKQAVVLSPETTTSMIVSPTSVPTSTLIPVTFTLSPLPTQPIIPVFSADPIQVERWKEYQTELAKLVLAQHSSQEFLSYETALCERDILGRTDQEVYVWAMCSAPNSGDRKPAVIHLMLDGSNQKVEVPFHGSGWESTIQKLFPVGVREKIDAYFYSSSSNTGRAEELRIHLQYRLTHPDVPPLIVLSAMPTTLTP